MQHYTLKVNTNKIFKLPITRTIIPENKIVNPNLVWKKMSSTTIKRYIKKIRRSDVIPTSNSNSLSSISSNLVSHFLKQK